MSGTRYAVQAAWFHTLDDDLEQAKQLTHDVLIARVADSRVGAVTWRWCGGDEAKALLHQMFEAAGDEATSNYLRRIRAMLREEGGHVMVAGCKIAVDA